MIQHRLPGIFGFGPSLVLILAVSLLDGHLVGRNIGNYLHDELVNNCQSKVPQNFKDELTPRLASHFVYDIASTLFDLLPLSAEQNHNTASEYLTKSSLDVFKQFFWKSDPENCIYFSPTEAKVIGGSAQSGYVVSLWGNYTKQPAESVPVSYYTEFQLTVIWDNGLKITAIALPRGDAAQISEFLN